MATLRLPAASRAALPSRGVALRPTHARTGAPPPRSVSQRRAVRLAVRADAAPAAMPAAAAAAATELGVAVRAFLDALFANKPVAARAPPPTPPPPPAPEASPAARLAALFAAVWAARIVPLLYEASYRSAQAAATARLAAAVLLAVLKAPGPVFEELGARCVDAVFIVAGMVAVALLRGVKAVATATQWTYDLLFRLRFLILATAAFYFAPTLLIYAADALKL